jgi:hypothetical protein
MSRLWNKQIEKHIMSSQELLARFTALEEQISDDLREMFRKTVGVAIPSALEVAVYNADTAMLYPTEVKRDEVILCTYSMLSAVFTGNEAELAVNAVAVVATALKAIIGSTGSVQTGAHGHAGKIHNKQKALIASCFASTALCSQQHWFTQDDFYISKYIFTVFPVRESQLNALAHIRTIDG